MRGQTEQINSIHGFCVRPTSISGRTSWVCGWQSHIYFYTTNYTIFFYLWLILCLFQFHNHLFTVFNC